MMGKEKFWHRQMRDPHSDRQCDFDGRRGEKIVRYYIPQKFQFQIHRLTRMARFVIEKAAGDE